MIVIARAWLLRVPGEGLPLQADARVLLCLLGMAIAILHLLPGLSGLGGLTSDTR